MKIAFLDGSTLVFLFYICIFIAVIAAWIISIKLFIQAGEAKGYSMENRKLIWFIGLFATPIVVGLYINSLPNRALEGSQLASLTNPGNEGVNNGAE